MMTNNEVIQFELGDVVTNGDRTYTKLIGGFGEGQPVLTDVQVAEFLDYKNGVSEVRKAVNRNNVDMFSLIDRSVFSSDHRNLELTITKIVEYREMQGFFLITYSLREASGEIVDINEFIAGNYADINSMVSHLGYKKFR